MDRNNKNKNTTTTVFLGCDSIEINLFFLFTWELSDHEKMNPTFYCSCEKCCWMETLEESICCKNSKCVDKAGLDLSTDGCITEKEIFKKLLDPAVLEVNLRLVTDDSY